MAWFLRFGFCFLFAMRGCAKKKKEGPDACGSFSFQGVHGKATPSLKPGSLQAVQLALHKAMSSSNDDTGMWDSFHQAQRDLSLFHFQYVFVSPFQQPEA